MTRRAELLGLAAITAVAALARFISLETVPPGLALDEGRMGLLAQAVLRGEDPRPWLHSMETPAWAPTVALFSFLPDSIFVLRAVPASWGTLTVPALWWAVRPAGGPAVALAAAFVLAVMRWHIALTRIAISGYFTPLVAVIAAGCLVRALAGRGTRWAVWSGVVAGAGMHWYAAARIVPLVLAAGLAGARRDGGPGWGALVRGWGAGVLAGFAAGGWYLPWHPERFLQRIREVGGEADSAGRWLEWTWRGLGALNVGGADLMHTYPAPGGSPLLGLVASVCWIPGIVLALRAAERPLRWMLGGWLAAGVVAGAFGGPHGMRQFLLAPVAALGTAVTAVALAGRLRGRGPVVALAALAAAHAGAELWRYAYGRHGGLDPLTVEWVYRGPDVAMATQLRDEAARRPVFWSPVARDPVNSPIEWYAGVQLFLATPPVRRDLPDSAETLDAVGGVVAFPMVSEFHLNLLRELYPGGEIWYGASVDPRRQVIIAVGPAALRRSKIPLSRTPELFRPMWEAERILEVRDVSGAIARTLALSRSWPGIGALHTLRAAALLAGGAYPAVVDAARDALAAGAAGGQVHLLLGGALLELRRFAEAVPALERAIREEPAGEEAWQGCIVALANSGRPDEARRRLRVAAQRFPGSRALAELAAQLSR